MNIKNSTNYISFGLFFALAVILISLTSGSRAYGLSGSDFNPGNIIDDATFYNSTAISPSQIQAFLDSKVPVCDTNGTQSIYGTTRAAYGASVGNPAPYTCLKDYSENVTAVTNGGSDLCTGSIAGGLKSAASIIYDVGQACGINPQVLIVMLQKEQSLITDDWPWDTQYDKAMGYACPDSGPNNSANCNSEYFGFFNQVYNAAKAFRRYEANPTYFNYRAERNNTVYYHPSLGACGSSNVFIENQATANLYIYTPYQPNQAALDNLYGTGDGCSAYGNRNFWRMYNDWFGTTQAPSFAATPVTSTSTLPTGSMVAGTRSYVVFKVRNTGNVEWEQATTRLGTADPVGRASVFQDSTWIQNNRATTLKELTVAPGEIGTFEFWYQAPTTPGTYEEKFTPVIEGQAWIPYSGLFLSTTVTPPTYTANTVSLGSYTSTSLSSGRGTSNMAPGESAYIVLRVRNNGNQVWKNSGTNVTRLAPADPNGRGSAFNGGWISNHRVETMDQPEVAPGQIATFRFWYRAPNIPGTHNEKFTIVHEGVAWTKYFGFNLNTTISTPDFSAQPVAAASSTSTNIMSSGDRSRITFKVRNTGNVTWKQANTRLGTAGPIGRVSTFNYDWASANRTSQLIELSVAPGEIGTFEFWYQAPTNPGEYTEQFTPVIEGKAWLPYSGLFLNTTVVN